MCQGDTARKKDENKAMVSFSVSLFTSRYTRNTAKIPNSADGNLVENSVNPNNATVGTVVYT